MVCRECWVDKENLEKGWDLWRFCVSDEHYVPTLLAVLGLDDQTDCKVQAFLLCTAPQCRFRSDMSAFKEVQSQVSLASRPVSQSGALPRKTNLRGLAVLDVLWDLRHWVWQ